MAEIHLHIWVVFLCICVYMQHAKQLVQPSFAHNTTNTFAGSSHPEQQPQVNQMKIGMLSCTYKHISRKKKPISIRRMCFSCFSFQPPRRTHETQLGSNGIRFKLAKFAITNGNASMRRTKQKIVEMGAGTFYVSYIEIHHHTSNCLLGNASDFPPYRTLVVRKRARFQ